MNLVLTKRKHARELGLAREGFPIPGHDNAWVNLYKGTYTDAHSSDWLQYKSITVKDLDTLAALILLHADPNFTAMLEILKN